MRMPAPRPTRPDRGRSSPQSSVEGSLARQWAALVKDQGVDFFGVADLAPAHDAILRQGGPAIASFPRSLSFGLALRSEIVERLPGRADPAVAIMYRRDGYELVNERLDCLSDRVATWLQKRGHRAMAVPASRRTDSIRVCGAFSHKLAARLAGLGWIGKSCLLVTPEVGPRVRWTTVLTDAPLDVGTAPLEEQCGNCRACVEICPVRAFTGRPFRVDEPREARYDAGKCDRYFQWMRRRDPSTAVCGLCLYVCPYGRSAGAPLTTRLPL